MNILVPLFIGSLFPTLVFASSWTFDPPVDVTQVSGSKIFHHLESAGRKNIAVSDDTIAITWEDERDEVPRIYLARKKLSDSDFKKEVVVSGKGEAFEPTIAALPDNRFVLAWEEDGKIQARVIGSSQMGEAVTVAEQGAQANINTRVEEVYILISATDEKFGRLYLHRLMLSGQSSLKKIDHCPVDVIAPKDDQLYPAGTMHDGKLLAAWEDRRPGHTIIMSALQTSSDNCEFQAPTRLSLRPEGRPNLPYGKGHGVSRVAITSITGKRTMAAWADKRDFREGYDIYAAERRNAGRFGKNVRVQDDFGGQARQWHTTIAGHPDGHVVVAWDDDREGNVDVMLSWKEQDAWSDDMPLPVGSGPGEQNHPSLAFDHEGNLHIAWVERETKNAPTRLRYSLGRMKKQP